MECSQVDLSKQGKLYFSVAWLKDGDAPPAAKPAEKPAAEPVAAEPAAEYGSNVDA